MQIGYVGLGKMGKNMVLRLHGEGVEVVAWNRSPEPRQEVSTVGVRTVDRLEDLPGALASPRLIWLMVASGDPVDQMIEGLLPYLDKGDILVDGGNSYFKNTLERNKRLEKQGIHYIDAGVSGGPSGARSGASVMVGGTREDFKRLEPFLKIIAAPNAYKHLGRTGAGHFVKMVHNGIEYGMMQAIAEGAAVLKASEFELDLVEVFDIYNHATVIESRLVGWAKKALEQDSDLARISSRVDHSGEGEWTIQTAEKLGLNLPVIKAAFRARLESSAKSESFRDKMVSALRGQFGGHDVYKESQ